MYNLHGATPCRATPAACTLERAMQTMDKQ